jgi:hypothetical protein
MSISDAWKGNWQIVLSSIESTFGPSSSPPRATVAAPVELALAKRGGS